MAEESITRQDAIGKALDLLMRQNPLLELEYRKNELLEAQVWLMVANTFKTYEQLNSARSTDNQSFPDVYPIVRAIDDLAYNINQFKEALEAGIVEVKETLTSALALRQPEETERPPHLGEEG